MRCGDGDSSTTPVGVISTVLVDERRPGWTLLGVRRPSLLNARHPNVLSVPTMRLPPGLFELLTADVPDPAGTSGTVAIAAKAVPVGRGARAASDTAFVVESLLAGKLGVADALQRGALHGQIRPRFLSVEQVSDPLGTDRSEWTAMLTYEVRLDVGAAEIPAATGCYSRLLWVESARIPRALAQHDALFLDETLNAVEVCVQGLCVRVAAELLNLQPGPGPG